MRLTIATCLAILSIGLVSAEPLSIFDYVEDFFNIFGINGGVVYIVLSLAVFVILGILIWKFGLCKIFIILGILIIILSLTDFVYTKWAGILIGLLILAIGVWWCFRKRRLFRRNPAAMPEEPPEEFPEEEPEEFEGGGGI